MKTLIRLAISAVALACLAACGGSDDKQSTSPTTPPTGPQTAGQVVAQQESNGTLPLLDRSNTVAGVDGNSNGVRDDIDLWIQKQPLSNAQKNALLQVATAQQAALSVNLADDAALRDVAAKQHAAVKCAVRRDVSSQDLKTLRQLIANTKERAQNYLKYSDALDGAIMESPAGDGCVN